MIITQGYGSRLVVTQGYGPLTPRPIIRHPDPSRSSGSRRGPDPSRSVARRGQD